jgi:hypothetical protein
MLTHPQSNCLVSGGKCARFSQIVSSLTRRTYTTSELRNTGSSSDCANLIKSA